MSVRVKTKKLTRKQTLEDECSSAADALRAHAYELKNILSSMREGTNSVSWPLHQLSRINASFQHLQVKFGQLLEAQHAEKKDV